MKLDLMENDHRLITVLNFIVLKGTIGAFLSSSSHVSLGNLNIVILPVSNLKMLFAVGKTKTKYA